MSIFVVSPFSRVMSHWTQNLVEKLHSEGDMAVFWLDTSGWFSSPDFEGGRQLSQDRKIQLNGRGARKAAAFLHAHLCRYLAQDHAQCPFMKHDEYTGKVYVPKDAALDKYVQDSMVAKLKGFFWQGETTGPQ